MFRLLGKMIKNNRVLADSIAVNDDPNLNRTKKIFQAIETICEDFDLGVPIWLDTNITEFKRASKTRFRQDSFIDPIDFDFLEIQVIEEDEP